MFATVKVIAINIIAPNLLRGEQPFCSSPYKVDYGVKSYSYK